MSGAGFGRATSSKLKTRGPKASARPSLSSFETSSARPELEATATASPAAATARTAATAPGTAASSCCMAAAMVRERSCIQRGGSGPTRASIIGSMSGAARPRKVSRASSAEIRQPRSVRSAATMRFTRPSLSARTPSQSNSTAAGRRAKGRVTPIPSREFLDLGIGMRAVAEGLRALPPPGEAAEPAAAGPGGQRQVAQGGDEAGVAVLRGDAEIAGHAQPLRLLPVLDIQLDQRLRMLGDEGDRADQHGHLVMRRPLQLVLGAGADPLLRGDAGLVADDVVELRHRQLP